MTTEQRDNLNTSMQLAEKLGASTIILQGQTVSDSIIDFARSHNINKIIIGRVDHPRWKEILGRTDVDRITHQNLDLDIYMIKSKREFRQKEKKPASQGTHRIIKLILALVLVGAATGFCVLLRDFFDSTNLVMIYLLATVIAAVYLGLGPSILVSILGVLIYDFLFISPYLSLTVGQIKSVFSLVTLLVVGVLISYLTSQLRRQTDAAWQRERQTAALYALGRDMAVSNDLEAYVRAILTRIKDTFGKDAVIFLPDPQKKAVLNVHPSNADVKITKNDIAAALWAFQHQKLIGQGTDTLPNAGGRYYPLLTARGIVGVLSLLEIGKTYGMTLEQDRLLEAYVDLAAVAMEGIILAQEARNTELLLAGEKLQTALLNSISHDLRTPLVSIIGALSSLQETKIKLDEAAVRKLVQVASVQAERLNRLITNLLDESRLEAGAMKVNFQPAELQDLVGAALEQLGERTTSHRITISLPANLSFISVDFGLVVHALVNILDNAIKYSPSGSEIEIKAYTKDKMINLEIADRGIGIPSQDLERVFDKFYRVHRPEKVTGTGLGLSIVRGIIEANNGRVIAENRPEGGTIIRVSIPIAEPSEKEQKKENE